MVAGRKNEACTIQTACSPGESGGVACLILVISPRRCRIAEHVLNFLGLQVVMVCVCGGGGTEFLYVRSIILPADEISAFTVKFSRVRIGQVLSGAELWQKLGLVLLLHGAPESPPEAKAVPDWGRGERDTLSIFHARVFELCSSWLLRY